MMKAKKEKEPKDHPTTDDSVATEPTPDVAETGGGAVTVEVRDTPPAKETPAAEDDWHDRYLRLAAEFDNYRKRSARQFEALVQSAERELISELTGVLDNLGRALDADHKGESVDDFARGMVLIRDQLWHSLEKRGLTRMTTVGEQFNPELHDALMRTPSDEYAEGVIAQEIAPGYMLNGDVLRHAQVVVSQGHENDESSDE